MIKSIKTSIFFITILVLSSCALPKLFQVVVNQGNLVDEEMLDKLEVGMTESQVRYVMGSPLVSDTFFPNRWDYYTSVTQGETVYAETKVTLYFEEGLLVKWEDNLVEQDISSK
tara:strand:- start:2824 stop:3165 length:342 start_codon:yes stop_codon:yes gene_type:complete